jgi:topoisomerase IA-like protein
MTNEQREAAFSWLYRLALQAAAAFSPRVSPADRPAVLLIGRDDFQTLIDAAEAMRLLMAAEERRKKQAKAAARVGGRARSEAKTRAARANAKKPRKKQAQPTE